MLTQKAAHRKDVSGKPATMTHQHFREIARIIREIQPATIAPTMIRAEIADYFADELQATNPRFDRARFLAACLHNPED